MRGEGKVRETRRWEKGTRVYNALENIFSVINIYIKTVFFGGERNGGK